LLDSLLQEYSRLNEETVKPWLLDEVDE